MSTFTHLAAIEASQSVILRNEYNTIYTGYYTDIDGTEYILTCTNQGILRYTISSNTWETFLKLSEYPCLGYDATDIFYLDSIARKLYIFPNNLGNIPISVIDLVTKKAENKAYSKLLRKATNVMINSVISTKSKLCLFGRSGYYDTHISYFILQKKIDADKDKFNIVIL